MTKRDYFQRSRELLFDKMLLYISFLLLPALFFSLLRITDIGFQPLFSLQIILASFIIFLSFFRKKIAYRIKVYSVIIIEFVLAIASAVNFGLAGFLIEYMMLSVLVSAVFLSKKETYSIFFITFIFLISIAYLFSNKYLIPLISVDNYMQNFSSWVAVISAYLFIAIQTIIIAIEMVGILHKRLEKVQFLNAKLHLLNEQIKDVAMHDVLTEVYNRQYFYTRANDAIEAAKRYKENLSILFIDIDFFKKINDTYGHNFGDFVLREMAQNISKGLRKSDVLCRWGGEEFIVLSPKLDEKSSILVANKIRAIVSNQVFKCCKKETTLTVSIGCTAYRVDETIDSCIDRADQALYHAKKSGRNRVVFI